MTLSETIELIEKAMEGATPGPWYPGHLGTDSTCQCRSIVDEGIYMGAIATVHVDNGLPIGEGGNDAPPAEEAAANMRYIAACNPVAISELLALAREAEALKREIAELRDALEMISAESKADNAPIGRSVFKALATCGEIADIALSTRTADRADQDGSAINTSGTNADPCRAPLCDCSMGATERCGRPGGAADPARKSSGDQP